MGRDLPTSAKRDLETRWQKPPIYSRNLKIVSAGSLRRLERGAPRKFYEFHFLRPWFMCRSPSPNEHPLQALTLLNDQAYVEMAMAFAERIIEHILQPLKNVLILHT